MVEAFLLPEGYGIHLQTQHLILWLSYEELMTYAIYISIPLFHTFLMDSSIPTCCAFVFKCKLLICTHLGGVFLIFWKFVIIIWCTLLQIMVLSSNTKKGEIERTFLKFCVLDNNTVDSSNVWCDVGLWHNLLSSNNSLKSKGKRGRLSFWVFWRKTGRIIRCKYRNIRPSQEFWRSSKID